MVPDVFASSSGAFAKRANPVAWGGWRKRPKGQRGPRKFLRASDLVGDLLDRNGAKRELREHRIATHWQTIVGPRVGARTLPDGLSKGVLWVRVSSSAWLHELSFLKDELTERVNKSVGDPPLVKEIRFHLGAIRGGINDVLPTVSIRRPPLAKRPLPAPASGAHLDAINRETNDVLDPELREIIREARRKLNL